MRTDPILNTPDFPISRLKSPKHAETLEVCCRQTFGKPSPLSGRKVAVPWREACTPAAQILALQYSTSGLHAFYRTLLSWLHLFQRNWKILRPRRPRLSTRPRLLHAAHPIPPLLMSFIEQNTIHLQTILKTLTEKCVTFKHIQTTSCGHVSGNVKYSTNT